MAINDTASTFQLPPLPAYTLTPLPPLLPQIADQYLTLVLPIIGYWVYSMIFHVIDMLDLFPQYRLHTPAEIAQRNRASRWEVVRDVVLQQIIQTISGAALGSLDPPAMTGQDDYNIAWWAQCIRLAQRYIPTALSFIGLDSKSLAVTAAPRSAALASVLSGGLYSTATFSAWELSTASAIYYYIIPAVQFGVAILIVDTWQYFLHRAMHVNKYLYTKVHSRHHRLYVPYAYGALYNHPVEGFLLDTLGALIAYLVTGMTARQTMWFFTCSTLKTVDDHCGYALPFDPLQLLTGNNAAYHDIHHQSWGIKSNFSQPFFTMWDRALGTVWRGDVSGKYERARNAAASALAKSSVPVKASDSASAPAPAITAVDAEATSQRVSNGASTRRSPQAGFKGLRERVTSSSGSRRRAGSLLGCDAGY